MRSSRVVAATLCALGLLATSACADQRARAEGRTLTVVAGELVLSGSGESLHSEQLVNATLDIGGMSVRLAEVQPASHPNGRRYFLHHFVRVLEGGTTAELCAEAPDMSRWAIVYADDAGRAVVACTAGAVGKCARFGYWPDNPTTRDLHAACVRMVRADYGGDGETGTREGMALVFCDKSNIIPCTDETAPLEAAWSKSGASCVARPRVPEVRDLDLIAAKSGRLQGRLGPDLCNRTTAELDPDTLLLSFATAP